ncbi:MAG: TetR family transcriptional regulator, partial [Solobacterium sp.]|nr:TetR family transcriptional regulator [Solobacterium sp.]
MTESTKQALAESLKKVLQEKPLDKITIADLTNDCGLNRQTFYYHYHDIYDLIEYIYISEG